MNVGLTETPSAPIPPLGLPVRVGGLKGFLAFLFLGLPALAQSLTLGGYLDEFHSTPTLELAYPFSEVTLELRATREALGLGL
ncbi:MAG: hypothetical protein C4300_03810, partial [Thermus sp.]